MKKLFFFAATLLASASLMAATYTPAPGENTIQPLVAGLADGDTIVLANGDYTEWNSFTLSTKLTIIAAPDAKPALCIYNIKVQNEVEWNGIAISNASDDNYIIRVYESVDGTVAFKNCSFVNKAPTAFLIVRDGKTLKNLVIDNCIFTGATKDDDLGGFISAPSGVVTNLTLTNSTFNGNKHQDCGVWFQKCANAYVDHCTFYNCGKRALYITNDVLTDVVYLVQNSIVVNPTSVSGACVAIYAGNVKNIMYYNIGAPRDGSTNTDCTQNDPKFTDAANGDFTLSSGSPALTAGTDGKAVGDPRWVKGTGTGMIEAAAVKTAKKVMVDGKMMIMRDGKAYNVLGF